MRQSAGRIFRRFLSCCPVGICMRILAILCVLVCLFITAGFRVSMERNTMPSQDKSYYSWEKEEWLLAVASSQIGNVGGELYWKWYGFQEPVEWCACFVSWCADQSNLVENDGIPKFASCSREGVPWFMEKQRWRGNDYSPCPGDLVFFDWNEDGQADHVGIVERIEKNTLYTIEGNVEDTCRRCSYSSESSWILGYGIL